MNLRRKGIILERAIKCRCILCMGVYRANDHEQQQGDTSQVYPTNVDQNNEENDCFKSAFCYPDEEKIAKKDNDDDAPMINEKYLNVSFYNASVNHYIDACRLLNYLLDRKMRGCN